MSYYEDNYYAEGGEKPASRESRLYGEDTEKFSVRDDGLTSGMNYNRGCSDCPMMVLFLGFITSLVMLVMHAHLNGDSSKLIAPIDGDGILCGYKKDNTAADGQFRDYDKLFITDLAKTNVKEIFDSGVCVQECPETNDEVIKYRPTSKVPEGGVKSYITSTVVTYCFPARAALPAEMKAGWKMAKDQFLMSPTGQIFNDMYLSSNAIYTSIFMAPIYCFIFIGIMSAFAETISWIVIATFQLGLIGVTIGIWFFREEHKNQFLL